MTFSTGCRMFALAAAALVTGCASHTAPLMTATQEAATYVARAKASYTPPGPPDDPWGPYIAEASLKYDVPERWVREVMRVESGGHEYRASGMLITSPVGAMGLMQLMPETYDEVRARYGLGDDAFDPHNNILAGTAYLREMYDAFGSPGFLAAYNGGPARLEDYLTHNRSLPTETRRYVAMIAPYIQGEWPKSRSPAEQYAVNQLPMDIPAGPRYARVRYASVHGSTHLTVASRTRHGHETVRFASLERHRSRAVEVAEAPEPRASGHHGFHLISQAMASEAHPGAGRHSGAPVGTAHGSMGGAHAAGGTLTSGHLASYHASGSGVTHDAAVHACRKSAHGHGGCVA